MGAFKNISKPILPVKFNSNVNNKYSYKLDIISRHCRQAAPGSG